MDEKRSGEGIIRLGEAASVGKWKFSANQLSLIFELSTVSDEDKRRLKLYCTSCDALSIQLPGENNVGTGKVIGFDRTAYTMTVYLAPVGRERKG